MTTVRPASKVLVTGATGKTGEALVRELLARGQPVRALVHRRDQRSEQLIGLGAEVVVADMFDTMDLAHALNGCDRAYYCPPWHPLMIQSAAAFAVAAQRTGLGSLVHLSQWLASPDNPSLASRQNWLVEENVRRIARDQRRHCQSGIFRRQLSAIDRFRSATRHIPDAYERQSERPAVK